MAMYEAAPAANPAGVKGPSNGIARDGKQLVVSRSYVFPKYCFVCGAPAEGSPVATHLHVTNRYHRKAVQPAAADFMALVDAVVWLIFLIAFVVDLPASRRRPLTFWLCARHRAVRTLLRWSALLCAVGGAVVAVVSLGFAFSEDIGAGLFFGGLGMVLAGAVIARFVPGPLMIAESAAGYRLSGAGEAFVAACLGLAGKDGTSD